MNMDHDPQDDPRLAALFGAVPAETCPADEDFLARLRRESSEAFTAAASEAARPLRRRHPMLVIALRGLASLAAAVAVAASLWLASNSGDSALTFGQALQNVAAADTLRLEITRDGKPADVWSRRAEQQLRVNRPDGTYTIVHGDRLWQIDEPANRATSRAASYFPADGKSGPDLLSLLDVPVDGTRREPLEQAALAADPARGGRVRPVSSGACGGRRHDPRRGVGRGRHAAAAVDRDQVQPIETHRADRPTEGRGDQRAGRREPVRRGRHPDRRRADRQSDRPARDRLGPAGDASALDAGRREDPAQAGRLAANRPARRQCGVGPAGQADRRDAGPRHAGRVDHARADSPGFGRGEDRGRGRRAAGAARPGRREGSRQGNRHLPPRPADAAEAGSRREDARCGWPASRARRPTSRSARWWPTSTAATCR